MADIANIATNIAQGTDGIWRGREEAKLSYPVDGNEDCFKVEDSSFWFKHRNQCIVNAVTQFPPVDGGPIYDIGGGNGYVTLGLINAGFDSVLFEPGPSGASNGRKRGIKDVICATTQTAGVRPASLSAVGLFDVVEHLENDREFLEHIRSLLVQDGRLYITVPAYSFLWSQEDILAGHHRRYSERSMAAVLEAAGFQVEYSTYIFKFLPLPIFLLRVIPYRLKLEGWLNSRRKAHADHQVKKSGLSTFLDRLLAQESQAIQGKQRMPFGGSCLFVCRIAKA